MNSANDIAALLKSPNLVAVYGGRLREAGLRKQECRSGILRP